ncbi:MAG TPA: hypothetical protein VMH83_00165 [Candidatus Acidoferrum sp.]|nr:hypothetical protein [Candidatus Acidoferrum sp.]
MNRVRSWRNLPTHAVIVTETGHRPQAAFAVAPFRTWIQPDGIEHALFYRNSDGFLVRFPGEADFIIPPDGTGIGITRVPGIVDAVIEHLLLNHVLPLALSQQYQLVLHAGAVEIDGKAVAFLADSGQGKSTLTASFAVDGRRFLTDDGLLLQQSEGRYLASSLHSSLRLLDDSRQALLPEHAFDKSGEKADGKARLQPGDSLVHCGGSCELGAIYVLGDDTPSHAVITPLAAGEAMIRLVRHCFLLGIDEQHMLEHQFRYFAPLAGRPVFFRLDYPRDYDCLPAVRQAVLSHLAGMGPGV